LTYVISTIVLTPSCTLFPYTTLFRSCNCDFRDLCWRRAGSVSRLCIHNAIQSLPSQLRNTRRLPTHHRSTSSVPRLPTGSRSLVGREQSQRGRSQGHHSRHTLGSRTWH